MPRGPKGEKRPADVIGNAIHVMRIATGEIEEQTPANAGQEHARKGGLKGGKRRAAVLTPAQRSEIARAAASARWKKREARQPTRRLRPWARSFAIQCLPSDPSEAQWAFRQDGACSKYIASNVS